MVCAVLAEVGVERGCDGVGGESGDLEAGPVEPQVCGTQALAADALADVGADLGDGAGEGGEGDGESDVDGSDGGEWVERDGEEEEEERWKKPVATIGLAHVVGRW